MTIHSFEKVLAEHPFFKDLSSPHLDTVVGCVANVAFQPGEFIFREGQPADHFFVVREGKVAVEVFVPNKGPVTIETIEGGEMLGWSWLFPPFKARFDARALNAVRALSLDGACLRTKCEKQESQMRRLSVAAPRRSVSSSTVAQKHVGQTIVQFEQARQRFATSSHRGSS